MGQNQSSSDDKELCLSCMVTFDTENVSWRRYLKQECSDLKGQCIWADPVRRQLKKIKKTTQYNYYQTLQQANQEFCQAKPSRTSSYQSSLNNSLTLKIEVTNMVQVQNGPKQPNEIKHLLKTTDILEDDLLEVLNHKNSVFIDNHMTSSFRTQSSRISNTPSHIFQEQYSLLKQIEQEPDLKNQIIRQIAYFIRITSILKLQLNETTHQLYQALQLFYQSFLKDTQSLSQETFDLQQFIRVFQYCISFYYDLPSLKATAAVYAGLLNDDNLLNFIVTIIFKNNDVYNHFYQTVKESQKEEIDKYSQNILFLKNKSPEDFKINERFSLDLRTYQYLNVQIPLNKSQPYGSSIQHLKSIKEKKSPGSKMKVIVKSQQKVMSSINRFYLQHGKKFDQIIDSDEVLKIQIYMLCHAAIEEISVDLYMIEKLSSNRMLSGSAGYYLITLYSAIDKMEELAKLYNYK